MSVCHEKLDIINHLVSNKLVDLNSTDTFGRTALHYACASGFVEAVNRLVQAGANYNLTNRAGETPLIKACQFAEIRAVELLLDLPQINLSAVDIVDRSSDEEWAVGLRYPPNRHECGASPSLQPRRTGKSAAETPITPNACRTHRHAEELINSET